MEKRSQTGWIEVICGSMFAGKTEELIRRLVRLNYAHKAYIVFKPKIDNRYSDADIVSHSMKKIPCIPVNNSLDVRKHLDKLEKLPDVVAFDEVQFFDEGLIKIIDNLADAGLRVIVAGLDLDFRGEPFGIMPILLAKAEEVTKLQAICQICGEPATRTQRIINGNPAYYDDPIIFVGATEKYEARCRKHHEVLKR